TAGEDHPGLGAGPITAAGIAGPRDLPSQAVSAARTAGRTRARGNDHIALTATRSRNIAHAAGGPAGAGAPGPRRMRTGTVFAAGTRLSIAWCAAGSSGLHSG